LVPSYVIYAILYGTLFALMSMGLTLTYMTTKVPNFAYGSFVTIGIYTAFGLKTVYNVNPYMGSIFAFVMAGAVSVLMYVGILRPLARRGNSLVSLMIATFAVDIGFIGIIGIYTDYMQAKYPYSDPKQFFSLGGDFTLFGIQGLFFTAPIVLAAITAGIYILLTRTKFGIAMRASVENASLAKILGINVERVNVASWMLAGGFAGLAGSLYTLWLPGGTNTGSDLIVYIFAASVLGGLTSIFGAVVGGLIIGSSADLVTTGLSLGLGVYATVGITILIFVTGGILLYWKGKTVRAKGGANAGVGLLDKRVIGSGTGVMSLVLFLLGIYMLVEMATGYSTDFFVSGLVNGFGLYATPYQPAVPLLVMVFTLLVIPRGIVSLKWGSLLRRKK
jgi:branched-chain amino acid transport system permease protein